MLSLWTLLWLCKTFTTRLKNYHNDSNINYLLRKENTNQTISRALGTVKIPSILKPRGLFREYGKRPDGMSVVPKSRGQCLVWDTYAASQSNNMLLILELPLN